MPNYEAMELRLCVEMHADKTDDKRLVSGYAAVFEQETEISGLFREVIQRGAFKKTLRENADIKILWGHNQEEPLGRTANRSLVLREDETGLHFVWYPGETQRARDAYEDIRSGNVDQMSFGFRVIKEGWNYEENDSLPLREVREVKLFEISPVVFPAYPGTSAVSGGRSAAEVLQEAETRGLVVRPKTDQDTTIEPGETHSDIAEPVNHSTAGDDVLRRIVMEIEKTIEVY